MVPAPKWWGQALERLVHVVAVARCLSSVVHCPCAVHYLRWCTTDRWVVLVAVDVVAVVLFAPRLVPVSGQDPAVLHLLDLQGQIHQGFFCWPCAAPALEQFFSVEGLLVRSRLSPRLVPYHHHLTSSDRVADRLG